MCCKYLLLKLGQLRKYKTVIFLNIVDYGVVKELYEASSTFSIIVSKTPTMIQRGSRQDFFKN